MQSPRLRLVILFLVLVLASVALLSAGRSDTVAVPGAVASYILLMLVPGLAIYLFFEKQPTVLEGAVSAVTITPVFVAIVSTLAMWGGAPPQTAVLVDLLVAAAIGIGAVFFVRRFRGELKGRHWLLLGGTLVVFLFLIGYLPLTELWWRFRSDAWFHRAVVFEIDDFGLPPGDPYFDGFELQYMWMYHVLIVVLSHATGLDPLMIPPLLNLQSFCGFVLGTVLLAGVFKRRFAYQFASALCVMLALNGLIWLFLPLKVITAFTGEVRGFDEIARQYTLAPLTHFRATQFFTVYYNQTFLLSKFVVATALSLSFASMAAFWYGTSSYMKGRRPVLLVLTAFALLGMLGFHPMVGFVMLIGFFGALVLLFFARSRLTNYSFRTSLILAGVCVLSTVLVSPYLYTIMRLKESQQLIPVSLTLSKIASIVISSAAVIVLTAFQRKFFKQTDPASRYYVFSLLTVTVFCLLIRLPGPNTYDKLPLFVFYPLAVIGGWSLVDYVDNKRTFWKKVAAASLVAVLFLVPVNAISFAALFNNPTPEMYTEDEKQMAAWVRENTTRESVFIDRDEEVFLVVAGPRRYYFGHEYYADFWGYNKTEMAARAGVRDALYGSRPLERSTLSLLGNVKEDLFVIDRIPDEGGPGSDALVRYPQYFKPVYTAGKMSLYKVDTQACLAASEDS